VKLPEDLNRRLNDLAAANGNSPHAFMLDAFAVQAARE
jgi:predicted transcriptional regulator